MTDIRRAAHTDHGTVLRPDQAALVFDLDGRMTMIVPNMPDDTPVPTALKLMLALAMLCNNEEWVESVIRDPPSH